jgi:hypothetical protein
LEEYSFDKVESKTRIQAIIKIKQKFPNLTLAKISKIVDYSESTTEKIYENYKNDH